MLGQHSQQLCHFRQGGWMQGNDLGGRRPLQQFLRGLNLGTDRPYLTVKELGIDAAIDQVHLQSIELALRSCECPFSLGPHLRSIARLSLHGFQPRPDRIRLPQAGDHRVDNGPLDLVEAVASAVVA
ncbi:hypothetical protein OU682_14705 [Paracoccus sp. EF6]|uniref:Uncharacterized protein n=1 Tax=Paracoccus benzoatiresistens TaxID=2997341 RepID=A0ABT4J6W3_9RHOB|nr:hypothetical protein [Paracoccus sp. EF6]MCZ0962868.1 hypothetical protein [Paracoccus sp. EF6]